MSYEVKKADCWVCKEKDQECVVLPPRTIMRLRDVYICSGCVSKMFSSFNDEEEVKVEEKQNVEEPKKKKTTSTKKKTTTRRKKKTEE